MELNTNVQPECFSVRITQLSQNEREKLRQYAFDLWPLYWAENGYGIPLSQLIEAQDMRLEFQPVGHHTPEDGRRFVVRRIFIVSEILRKLELNGVPTRFDWTKDRLGDLPRKEILPRHVGKSRGGAT